MYSTLSLWLENRKRGTTMNLLEVKSICKTYGSGEAAVHALKDVSLSISESFPTIISLLWITVIHLRYKQTLLSISTAVFLYLILVN